MPKPSRRQFYWRGANIQGQFTEGYIQASNKNIAAILLSRQGITIRQLKRTRQYQQRINKRRIVVSFFRQLAILLKANFSLMHALETLKLTQHLHILRHLIDHIQQQLQQGLSFSKALEQYPQYFTPLMCRLVALGEQASQFDAIISKLALYEERQLQTQRQFYLALAYPILIAIISSSLMIALCIFVLPQFLNFYQAFQVELPKLTQCLMSLTKWMKCYGTLTFIFVLLLFVTFRFLYQYQRPFRKHLDHLLLRIPYFGTHFSTLLMARLADTLSITLHAGLPLFEALKLLISIAGNTQYEEALLKIHTSVREGVSLTQAMRLTRCFSPDFLEMVAIGEESGKLTHMFSEIASHLEDTIKRHTLLWGKLLEPLTIAVLGTIMGVFLLALYLPIFQLGVAL